MPIQPVRIVAKGNDRPRVGELYTKAVTWIVLPGFEGEKYILCVCYVALQSLNSVMERQTTFKPCPHVNGEEFL